MSKKSVALILSGSGHADGAEITESVSLMIALSQHGYSIDYYAPNRNQFDVINHFKGEGQNESRNILIEAARIARGNIKPLEDLTIEKYQAIALAGGFGVVKNFTNFLEKGKNATLTADIAKVLYSAINKNRAIVAICAAPLTIAMACHEKGVKDAKISFGLRNNAQKFLDVTDHWGISHIDTKIDECYLDEKNRFITSGAYMYDEANPCDIFKAALSCIETLDKII